MQYLCSFHYSKLKYKKLKYKKNVNNDGMYYQIVN